MAETLVSVRIDLTRERLGQLTAFAGQTGSDVGSVVRAIIDSADLDGTGGEDVLDVPKIPDAPVLTVAEVARYLRVSPVSVYQWINQGRFPHRRVGSRRLIPRDEFMKWFKSGVAGGDDR